MKFCLFQTLNKEEERLEYTFFRGTKEQLTGGPMPEPGEMTVTVTVVQAGLADIKIQCPGRHNKLMQNTFFILH